MTAEGSRAPLSAAVEVRGGRPTLLIDGEPQQPMIYALTDSPGGRFTWEEVPAWSIAKFAERGFRLFYASLWLEWVWSEDGTLDVELARRQIRGVLDVCPDAAVILRLHVNSPRWWNERHPEDLVEYADGPVEPQNIWGLHRPLEGDLDRTPRHSLASRRWMDAAGAAVAELCRLLADTPEGGRLVGLHLAAGVFHEWHYYGFIEHEPDTGPAMTAYFRDWLRAKYGTDDALRAAWTDPAVALGAAEVPGVDERLHTSDGYFRDPERERPVIDYFECHQAAVADAVLHFCRIAKQSWPRPLVTGAFYGYYFTMFGRMAAGGHLQPQRLFASPDIDFLSAPQSYREQRLGGSGQSRGIVESARLWGKLWLDEMDHAPEIFQIKTHHHENSPTDLLRRQPEYPERLRESVATLRRNVVSSFVRGMGLWFYDFGPKLTSGWWDNPDLLEEIGRLRGLLARYAARPFESAADVLLVYDTDCFYHLGHKEATDPVSPAAIDGTGGDLHRSGVAFDTVYLADIARVDLDRYRAVLFANAFLLTDEQRAFVRERVARNGRHLIWQGAPGYTDGRRLDAAGVSEAAGVRLRRLDLDAPPRVTAPSTGSAPFGIGRAVRPLFVVDDPDVEPVGHLAGAEVALASKRHADHVSWFCSVPLQGAEVLRHVLRTAGAHVYSDARDSLVCGAGLLCVHTADGGPRTLTLRDGTAVGANLEPRSTSLFDAATGERLF